MNKSRIFLLFLCVACVAPFPAYADIRYNFVKLTCSKDLHLFSMESFMLWNACNGGGQHGGNCSDFPSLKEAGIYEVGAASKDAAVLPADCDVGFGKVVHVALEDFGFSERDGLARGSYRVTIDGDVISATTVATNLDLKVSARGATYYAKGRHRPLEDPTTHRSTLFPVVEIKACRGGDEAATFLAEKLECSFQQISDDPEGKKVHSTLRKYIPEDLDQSGADK
jgi:hypothetical protein